MTRKSAYLLATLAVMWLVSPVVADEAGKGKVLFEYFYDIGNSTAVSALTSDPKFPDSPDNAEWLTSFFAPSGVTAGGGVRDNYGIRGRAYVVPPQTGDYTFWVAGDDNCELWLSTDDQSANAKLIAQVTGWTPAQDWNNTGGGSTDSAAMKSEAISLIAGQRYYIEGLMKEAGGGESIGVAWAGPGIGNGPVLLDGKYCYAFIRDPEPLFQARNPDPADKAVGVQAPFMQWTAGGTAMWHNVYFGTDPNPPLVGPKQTYALYYHIPGLEPGVQYFWKVDEIEADGVTIQAGPVWSFVAQALTNYYPQPDDGASFVSPLVTLTWEPGRDAVKHHVYFGEDRDAVAAGDAATDKGEVNDVTAFTPGELAGATTFYWRVDAIERSGNVQTGEVWSFTTYILVDEFEAYDDVEGTGTRIYETWIDGYTDGLSGSTIGNLDPPFAEQTIVHGGAQSMPMDYNNVNSPYFSQGYREFAPVQNWTVDGVTDLSLWVRGHPAPVAPAVEDNGKLTVSGEGGDIWGAADQFTFVYKTLNGDGSLIAHVVSNGTGSNRWAKGGVMIRDSLDAGSASAQMVLTGGDGNGAAFQNRAATDLDMGANDSTSNTPVATAIAPPYWVKVERVGDTLSGYVSPDNTTWTQVGDSQYVAMDAPAYIGLCVTSHAAGEYRTFEFDNVKATGASGNWRTAEVGLTRNSPQPLYLIVEDSAGKQATVVHPDAAAVNTTAWVEWKIPLSDLTGVNLAKVERLYIGVGDKANPTADGTGRIYIDDIRVFETALPEDAPE